MMDMITGSAELQPCRIIKSTCVHHTPSVLSQAKTPMMYMITVVPLPMRGLMQRLPI
jgi:hypothetical protein